MNVRAPAVLSSLKFIGRFYLLGHEGILRLVAGIMGRPWTLR
jgi:hypothetical protein